MTFLNLKTLASIHRGIGKTLATKGKSSEALDSLRQAIAIGERITGFDYDLACGLALYSEVVGMFRLFQAVDQTIRQNGTPTRRCSSCSKPSTAGTEKSIGSSATRNSVPCTPALISKL